MRRLLLLAVIVALVWRKRSLDAYDRENGFGPYCDVRPVLKESGVG